MNDLDAEFAQLAAPQQAAPQAPAAPDKSLDAEFAALAGNAPAKPPPQAQIPPMSGWDYTKAALSSFARHPFTSGIGGIERGISGVTGGVGSLMDAVTGSDPGTYDFAYRPRTEAGKEQEQLAAIAGGKVGKGYDAAFGTGPLATTLKERIPEALNAVGTVASLPQIPKAVGGAFDMATAPFPRAMPSPQLANRAAVLQAGQNEGYVVPPSTGNPTFTNRLLGGIAGKTKVQQAAQQTNRQAFAQNAATSIGQPSDFVFTPENLAKVRADAFDKGYTPVKGAGQMTGDETLNSAIDAITARSRGASRSFPEAFPANDKLNTALEGLKKDTFDSGDAIDAIAELRSRASDAFRIGDGTTGRAYRSASKALEDSVERNLAARGKNGAQLLQNYRDARTTIAKTHSIEDALQGDEPDAVKLYNNGGPLSGQLKTAANMAGIKAFKPSMSLPSGATEGISPLDVYGAVGGALASHSALPLGIPLTRSGIARYLLSPAGQARAIPKAFRQPTPAQAGLLGTVGPAAPVFQSLFNMPPQTP